MKRVLFLLLLLGLARGARAESEVHLKDGRVLRGTIIHQDADQVEIKLKFGKTTIARAEIDRIEEAAGTTPPEPGPTTPSTPKAQAETFRNLFLGYQVSAPGSDWVVRESPPAPLRDVSFYHPATQTELSVIVLPDTHADVAISADTAELFTEALRKGLQETFRDVKELSRKVEDFKGQSALRMRFEGISKFDDRPSIFDSLVFKLKGRNFTFSGIVSKEQAEAGLPFLAAIADSFQEVQAQELEAGVYNDFTFFFSAVLPPLWTFAHQESGAAFTAPDELAAVTIVAQDYFDKKSLVSLMDERETEISKQAVAYTRVALRTVPMLRSIGQELCYTDETEQGTRNCLERLFISDTKKYTIRAHWVGPQAEAHRAAIQASLDSFQVKRNLTARASIEVGYQAIEKFAAGDQFFLQKQWDAAIKAYDEALSLFPNYGAALNSLGICYAHKQDFERAFTHSERAYKLFKEDIVLRRNLADLLADRAQAQVQAGAYKEAIDDLDQARRLHPQSADLDRITEEAYYNWATTLANKGQHAQALVKLKAGLTALPKNERLAGLQENIKNEEARLKAEKLKGG